MPAEQNSKLCLSILEQQKRRRFHPLRNLRRIFRRRTITSATDSSVTTAVTSSPTNTLPPTQISTSEKNLRGATLRAISTSASASSPSSSLTNQQLEEAYLAQSFSKSRSFRATDGELISNTICKKKNKSSNKLNNTEPVEEMYTKTLASSEATSYSPQHEALQQCQSIGISVLPNVNGRSDFQAERHTHRNIVESLHKLGSGRDRNLLKPLNGGEISNSQRSLSEWRLMDSDCPRDTLSQSHDSVFSESATASNLSIVLKTELADVLRKRRNRPDASDEDLGLPRSPSSPQQITLDSISGFNRQQKKSAPIAKNGSKTTALSVVSINSFDSVDFLSSSTGNNSSIEQGIFSISASPNTSVFPQLKNVRQHEKEDDSFNFNLQRLSHSAAKHKMAIRPTNKKVPSRQQRKTVDITTLKASMSNFNPDNSGLPPKIQFDSKTKTKLCPLPPTVNTNRMDVVNKEMDSAKSTFTIEDVIENKITEKHVMDTLQSDLMPFSISCTNSLQSNPIDILMNAKPLELLVNEDNHLSESGSLRRVMDRNPKCSSEKTNNFNLRNDFDLNNGETKKLQISTSCLEASNRIYLKLPDKSRSATSYEQNIEETRKTIKREINNEGTIGLSIMLNSYSLHSSSEKESFKSENKQQFKPKAGPAARQRYEPQELGSSNSTLERQTNSSHSSLDTEEVISITNLISKSSRANDSYQSTPIKREDSAFKKFVSVHKNPHYFDKKSKFLNEFETRIARSNDSFGQNSNSSNSLETSTDEPSLLYYTEKHRKSVGKSRSFRNAERDVIDGECDNNVPSLPDLSLSFRVPVTHFEESHLKDLSKNYLPVKCSSLGFEINDNKLLKSTLDLNSSNYLQQNQKLILTTASTSSTVISKLSPNNSCNTNISEIEQNIDLIVTSPFVSILRKSGIINNELTAKSEKTAANECKSCSKGVFEDLTQPTPKSLENVASSNSLSIHMREKQNIATVNRNGGIRDENIRKSAPIPHQVPVKSFKITRRSSSVIDNLYPDNSVNVPEFLKIQLNRVELPKLKKSNNVVLAKYVKEKSNSNNNLELKCNNNSDDTIMRRCSSESVEITEQEDLSPTEIINLKRPTNFFEAINKQTKETSISNVQSSNGIPMQRSVCKPADQLTPLLNSPVSASSIVVTHQPIITLLADDRNEPFERFFSPISTKSSKFSLEERKRLFLNEDKTKTNKKIEEIRNERKKSINEELNRMFDQTIIKEGKEKKDKHNTASPTAQIGTVDCNTVVMRKKSVSEVIGNNRQKEDSTPELIKVFARRSLKVKEEDTFALSDKVTTTSLSNSLLYGNLTSFKKLNNVASINNEQQCNVDSDKENQSASEEKLDNFLKHDTRNEYKIKNNNNNNLQYTSNRSSLSDFRNTMLSGNNNTTATSTLPYTQMNITSKSSAKIANQLCTNLNTLTCSNTEHNNNHSSVNNKQTTTVIGTQSEPQSSIIKQRENCSTSSDICTMAPSVVTKSIERSATIGEFKGIHQRRAEWEQRAKESFK